MQLNTLDSSGKTLEADEHGTAEKTGVQESTQPIDIQQGHLQEIEVDIQGVLKDDEVKDIDDDTSPYPEVRAVVPETDDPSQYTQQYTQQEHICIACETCNALLCPELSNAIVSMAQRNVHNLAIPQSSC